MIDCKPSFRLRTLTVAMATLAWAPVARAIAVGDTPPAVALQAFEPGPGLDLAHLGGRVTLVNFWATWCEACKVELAEMEVALAPLLNAGDVRLALVTLDKEPAKAASWLKAHLRSPGPWVARLYTDPKFELADALGVDAFPMTLVMGANGRIARIQRGFKPGDGSTAALAKFVSGLRVPAAKAGVSAKAGSGSI